MARLLRAQLVALGGITVAIAALGWQCAYDRDVVFLDRTSKAQWIAMPDPIEARPTIAKQRPGPRARFTRNFRAPGPGSARLCFRAVRWGRVLLNGSEVAANVARDWKRETCADIGSQLVAGTNRLEVRVGNWRGPRLLELRVEGLPEPLVTDTRWRVALGDAPGAAAIVADDTRVHPDAHSLRSVAASLSRVAPALGLLFLAGVGVFAALRSRPSVLERLPSLALLGGCVFWVAVWFTSVSHIPAYFGFDSAAHGDYILVILKGWRLPLSSEGWSMFHPPLFHALAALWLGLFEVLTGRLTEAVDGAKIVPFVAGAGQMGVTFGLARRWLPRDAAAIALAVSMAAVLPMNLYMASYISNESLHGLLAGVAILFTVDLLSRARLGYRHMAGLGVVLGLALLTKATALLVAVVSLGCVAIRLLWVDRRPRLEAVAQLGLGAALVTALAGWFYVRNYLHFGTPLAAGWDLLQHPGFRTGAYYAGFGESLHYPYFAGFHSFADALYSTLWGDSLTGGTASPRLRHRFWNYDAMSSVALLALPATGLLMFGLARVVHEAFVGSSASRRLQAFYLFGLTAVFALAIVGYSLQLPFYSTVKSFFALALVAPLCLYFGIGAATAGRWLAVRGRVPVAIFYGWLAAFLGAIALSFTTTGG